MEKCSVLIASLTTTIYGVKKKEIEQKLRFLFSHHMTITVSITVVHLHEVLLLPFIISLICSLGLEKEDNRLDYFTEV